MSIKRHISHIKSKVVNDGKPQLPSADVLEYGEIAINYAEGVETITIKSENDAVTPFSSDDYYTKQKLGSAFTGSNQTVTDVINSLDGEKVDESAFTAHTASSVHMDATEKENLDSLATNIAAISGITAEQVNDWDTAVIAVADNELIVAQAINQLSGGVSEHAASTTLHFSGDEKENLDSLATNIAAISGISEGDVAQWNKQFDEVKYELSGTTHVITFYHDDVLMDYIDADDFIKDGMVSSASVSGDSLVIVFNEYGQPDPITIPLTDIFNPANYYDMDDIDDIVSGIHDSIDAAVSGKADSTAVTQEITAAVSGKANSSDVYTTGQTYSKIEVDTALSAKADTATTYTKTEVDDKLGSAFTGSNSGNTVTSVIEDNELVTSQALNTINITLSGKQDTLVSGTNIKTINYESILGSGNISIPVDQTLSTSSTNAVANSAVTTAINSISGVVDNKVDTSAFTAHTTSTALHFSGDEKANLDSLATNIAAISGITTGKVSSWDTAATNTHTHTNKTVLDGISSGSVEQWNKQFDRVEYEMSGTTHVINFYHENDVKGTIDADVFIKDGMVDSVAVTGGNLVITFNTAADKQTISIPLTEFFDPDAYYTKTDIDDKLGSGFTGENSGRTITEVIEDNELVTSAALNDLYEIVDEKITMNDLAQFLTDHVTVTGNTLVLDF